MCHQRKKKKEGNLVIFVHARIRLGEAPKLLIFLYGTLGGEWVMGACVANLLLASASWWPPAVLLCAETRCRFASEEEGSERFTFAPKGRGGAVGE